MKLLLAIPLLLLSSFAFAIDPPETVVAESTGNGQIVLQWDTVTGASAYQVYRNDAFVTSVIGTSYTDEGEGLDEGLVEGVFYEYNIVSVDISQNEPQFSEPSLSIAEQLTLSTDDDTPVDDPIVCLTPVEGLRTDAPQDFSVRLSETGGSVLLSWSEVQGASGYNVFQDNQYVDTLRDGDTTTFAIAGAAASTFHVVAFTDHTFQTTYSVRSLEKSVFD